MRLQNKVAVVTGGARGIGKAVAELFAREGAQVIIWDIQDVGVWTSAGPTLTTKGTLQYRQVDITNREQIGAAVAAIIAEQGRIDILINNAGILRDKSLVKMTEADWAASISVNLTGVFNCTQAVVPHMKSMGYGRIVSASSIVGMRGNFGQTNYSATKAGIIGMTKSWALELGKYGITANAIAPGFTRTAMTASIPEEILAQHMSQVPVGFLAEPIDIAYGYLFLASDEARFVNGVCLNIDGGVAR